MLLGINTTSCFEPTLFELRARLVQYSLYGITGGAAAFFNALIVLSITKYRALRNLKDYIIIGGLSLADTIFGLGHFFGSVYRLTTFAFGIAYCRVPRIWCMLTPQLLFWRIGGFTGPAMLLVVSIDRMATVSQPLRYYLSPLYALKMVGGVYLAAMVFYAAHWLHPFRTANQPVSAYCSSSATLSPELYSFELTLASTVTALSVLIYLAVVIIFKKRNTGVQKFAAGVSAQETAARLKWVHKITITLGISSATTFALVTFPIVSRLILKNTIIGKWLPIAQKFSSYGSVFVQLNAVANFFIYGLRQKEMKTALNGLILRKHLPDDVKNWNLQLVVHDVLPLNALN